MTTLQVMTSGDMGPPLPLAGEGRGEGERASPHPNPLPQAGEGALRFRGDKSVREAHSNLSRKRERGTSVQCAGAR